MQHLIVVAALALALPAFARPAPADPAAREAALSAIAAGRLGDGIDTLRKAVGRGEGAKPDLLCLLGHVELLAARPADAERTLARVPADAPCARQAAFGRADALVALGRPAEAAVIYAAQGAPSLGPDRDRAVVAWLEVLGKRALAEDKPDMASGLFQLALEATLSPGERVALARRVADALLALPPEKPKPSPPEGLVDALLQGLLTRDDAAARRVAARFLPPTEALALLEAMPADAATLQTAAELALPLGVDRALPFHDRLAALKGEGSAEAGRKATLLRAGEGRLGTVAAALRALAAGADDAAMKASNLELDLLERAGERAPLVAAIMAHLKRFPADPRRTANEQRVDRVRLQLGRAAFARGRHAEAIAAYDALVARDPRSDLAAEAAWEAGLAARAAGQAPEARRRFEELRARWPDRAPAGRAVAALARMIAFDEEKPAEALAWLEAQAREGQHAEAANAELARLKAPDIALQTTRQRPGQDARVQVIARNLEWVEARLHRIDPEAFLRAGGDPEALPELDVAVIAPDKRWKVKVPRYAPHRDVAFDLAVPRPDPGLYMITVAAEDREASAVLWISDLRLMARAVGPDVVVAALDGEAPAAGAEILVRLDDGHVVQGETGKDGLWRTRLKRVGGMTLLGTYRGAPALLGLSRSPDDVPAPGVRLSADLDRPAWRPGDLVRFRVAARRDGKPVAGTFTVWLADGEQRIGPTRLEAGPLGTFSGAIPAPATVTGRGPWRRSLSLMVQAPGADNGEAVATVLIAPEGPPVRALAVEMAGTDAVCLAREADDRPAANVTLRWEAGDGRTGTGRTDARGRLVVPGPPAGLSWNLSVSLGNLRASAARDLPGRPGPSLHLDDAGAGRAPRATLQGPDGQWQLTVAPLAAPDAEAPVAPADRWVPRFEAGLVGADGVPRSFGPPRGVEGAVTTRTVDLKGGRVEVDLGALPAGAYSVRVTPADGRGAAVSGSLRVGDTLPGLAGLRDGRVGDTLALTATGAGPMLVVAGGDRVLAAALVRPGAGLSWPLDATWSGAVTVRMLGLDGRVAERDFVVDPTLDVAVAGEDVPGADGQAAQWALTARVTDGAGRPVAAEVVLRVVDEALLGDAGAGVRLNPDSLTDQFPREADDGVFGAVRHAVEGEVIAAELMAEAAREAEAARAQAAASGRFQANAVNDVLSAPPLAESIGFGGLGTVGRGAGGGGMGRGYGAARLRHGKAVVTGARYLAGEREVAAWAVLRTDADGRVRLTVPRPDRARRWSLIASAVAATGFGAADVTLDTRPGVRLRLASPAPGSPDEQARLQAVVLNGSAAPLAATVGGQAVEVPAGEARLVDLGLQPAGTQKEIDLVAGGRVLARATWRFPLAEGAPDAAGRVLHIAAAPGGGVPAAHLALRPDVAFGVDAGRTATAGRAALAALAVATPAERPALEARAWAARDALRGLSTGAPLAAAEVLLFLAEGRDRLGVTRGEIEAAGEALGSPGADPEERAAVLHARATAGLPVDASALARLERTADLPPAVASRLARLLILEKRAKDAAAFVRGDDVQATLARRALKQPATAPSTPPPPAGDRGLPDWIRAVAAAPGKGKGVAVIRLAGQEIGRLDRATGGELRAVAPAGALTGLELDGLAATVWRSNPASAGAAAPVAWRLPTDAAGNLLGESQAGEPEEPGCVDGCTLAVGEGLTLPEVDLTRVGGVLPGGFTLTSGRVGPLLRARVPGTYVLRGLVHPVRGAFAPLTVTIADAAGPAGLVRADALLRAEAAVAAQDDPLPWLAPWPEDRQWPDGLLGRRAAVRFEAALAAEADAATLVDRFEALREASPDQSLVPEQVARVARAYEAAGRPDRAVDVWRVGLGGTFLAEAGAARRVEEVAGVLASLQGLRALAERYPALPAVEQALFLLPQRLDSMATEGDLPEPVVRAGVTRTDLRLMAAAWDREFVALWPKSPLRGEAAFHLVRVLQDLDAHAESARWATLLAGQLADSALLDGLLYLEGLARLRLREDDRALKLFERISTADFPQEDGSTGPAGSRDDARYALARLYEARGELKRAREAYAAAAGTHEEAAQAAQALTDVTLRVEPFTRVRRGETLRVPVTAANLETLHVRAYRLDLRTIFLRDGGLDEALGVNVSGVSPVWSGERDVDADAFPRPYPVALPLEERGAYLVQVDGGGASVVTLVVRSDLDLRETPDPEGLRVTVRLAGKPAAGVALRSAGGGGVQAAATDVRGVARVAGPHVIAFTEAGDVAFTPPAAWTQREDPLEAHRQGLEGRGPPAAAPRQKTNVDERMEQQLRRNEALYEQNYRFDNNANIDAKML